MTQNPTEKTGRENNPMDDDWNKHIPRQTADEQGDNNPMSSDLTKPDGAVERLTELVDRSSLSIIDQISMLATGEATVGALVDDIRSVVTEIDRKEMANHAALSKVAAQSAEIERLRVALSKIMVVRKQPGKCKRLFSGEILQEIELIAAQALKGGV